MVTILMLSTAIAMLSMPASAQSSGEMASYAYLSVEPNPVGIGQTTYVAMWVDFPMPGATEANSIRRHDYKLVITAPDGTTETKTWAEVKDTTGVQSTSYTPTKAGNYTFYFEYPKQNYTWSGSSYTGVWFLADNATATLTVQEEPVNRRNRCISSNRILVTPNLRHQRQLVHNRIKLAKQQLLWHIPTKRL